MSSNKPSSVGLFLLYFLILLGSLFRYGPNVVFYFDQLEAKALITEITGQKVHLAYDHISENGTVKISFREENTKKLRTLAQGQEVAIVYSDNFPSRVTIFRLSSKA